jgi:hypothetical protein
MTLVKRLTLVVRRAGVEPVFYPVFPPNESASQVIEWLSGSGRVPYGIQSCGSGWRALTPGGWRLP